MWFLLDFGEKYFWDVFFDFDIEWGLFGVECDELWYKLFDGFGGKDDVEGVVFGGVDCEKVVEW